MMSHKCKVGVLGVGHLGSIHAKLLKEVEVADLIGVFDTDGARAKVLSEELAVRAFPSPEALLREVNAVVIAASTKAHYDLALQAIEAGVHPFIEKPLADTAARARDVVQRCEKAGLKLGVGHIERFNRAVRALEGMIIAPRFIEAHRLAAFTLRGADVAVIHDLMIHDLDLILHWVKAPVKRLDASGVAVISDTPDIANARIAFENGCVANVTASRISRHKMRKMRLFQNDAYLSLDFSEGKTEIYRLAEPGEGGHLALELGQIEKGKQPRKILYQQPVAPEANALKMELELYLQAILEDKPVPVSGEDGVRALELAEEVLRQIELAGW
ncbi:MAG: Gfo/Idh/MocA family oxidoreductase [bacterium]|nr:Gfo/Idh/MocA family oxidoreductase [bacterium]